jgi:hypothetical protein
MKTLQLSHWIQFFVLFFVCIALARRMHGSRLRAGRRNFIVKYKYPNMNFPEPVEIIQNARLNSVIRQAWRQVNYVMQIGEGGGLPCCYVRA